MTWKKFLSGALVGAFTLGISAADIQTAEAASYNDERQQRYEEYEKERIRRENQRISERKERIRQRNERRENYENDRKEREKRRREHERDKDRYYHDSRKYDHRSAEYYTLGTDEKYIKYATDSGISLELLATSATDNVKTPPQMKDGQRPPEPPKDSNGNVMMPPDGKNPPQMKDGQKPPEPPKDSNGNPLPPPDKKIDTDQSQK